MNPQIVSPNSPVQDNSLLQQGYLQVIRNGEALKVFAVLTPKNLLIYSEDPTKYQNAELSTSIDIAKSKLLEEGNFKRPKSFGVFSDQNFLEFSCATNSSRLSWLKSFNNAKESSESLQKLKGIKATMDLYRAPTVVGRSNPAPNPTSSLASSPNHASILRSKFSGSSKNLFGDTFSQLKSLNNADSLPPNQSTQQLQNHAQQQPQQSHVSFATPNLIAQPKLKKNIVAKPSTIGKSTVNSQQNETQEPPRWIPGNYKVPGQANNNRSITPQKVSQPAHRAHSGYQRAASAPNRRPNEKSNLNKNNQILFTPVGASNLYATGGSSEYSSLPGKPLSINTLQHNQQQHHIAQQHLSFQSLDSYQQSSYQEYLPHQQQQQQQHPTHSLHNYQLPPNNSQYSTNIPPAYFNGNIASFPQPSPATGPNAMEHLTLAQIRAALLSIPVPIRSALMNEDTVPSTNKVQHIDRSQSVGNRDDIVRPNNNSNRPQHRAPPTKEMSDDDSSSLDSGYIASGGKTKKTKTVLQRRQSEIDDNVNKHRHNRQLYEEEEMLGATTYSDSHFQMRSRQLYEDNDKEDEEEDINNDDANGYGMANIYSNGGSPDEKLTRDDADLAVSARSNPMLKSQSLRRDTMLKSNSMQIKTSTDATVTKKMLLEQGKRPNPLQRSKSAPISRPSTNSASISQQLQRSKSPANSNAMTNSNIPISADKGLDKDVRDSILTWSKRQARDKRIGMNYFGNTKKGVQLMQSQGISESPSNSASPQRRASTTDVPVVAFSKPLAFRKTPTQSANQDIGNKLGTSQLGKPLKATTPSAGTKSFFEFKKSSKTVDAAVSQHPEASMAGNINSTPTGKPLQPQQKETLELQLLKYQQGLQRKRQEGSQQGGNIQPQTKPGLIPTLSQQPPAAPLTASTGQASGMQQKWQLDYAAKRQALFAAAPSSRPKPVVPPLATFSRSTSYQSTPTTRPNRSESYESALYNNSHVEDEEITDKAESHRFRSWLESIYMDHYLSNLRDNGVNKLSLLELLTGNDLAQIGIPELDATIILEKARELTERIKSFSENADIKDWNTISMTNGMSSSKLATPTSISRRKDSYGTQPQKIPESPSAIPWTLARIVELKTKLIEAYKGGELDKFFMLWERLPSFPQPDPKFKSPDLNILLRAERPALVTAKQAMEFHLHLYFFVYALKYLSTSKISVLKAKSALRKYLDKIASSQQEDPSAPNSPFKTSSPLSSAQALQQLNASMDPSTSPVNTSFDHMSARNLFATREFATFAGLVFVPNPQTNPAFQSLFREEWSVALLERLQKFLDVAFPNDETKSMEKESTVKVENNDIRVQEKIINEPTKSPLGAKLDGSHEIIRPAPIRPATDVSVSIHSGNTSVKKTTMPDIFMSPPQQEQEITPQVTSADSQKLIAKVPSLSSSFESPPPQPPLSAQSIRSQTIASQQPPLSVQELPSTVGVSPAAPAPPMNVAQPSPQQEPENVMDPSPAKVLLEEEMGNGVILLDGNREACISPASSISQLTDDTPLNRVSASLNGQAAGSTGYSQQHTMNAWLQNSQPTTVAGTRPQRIKVSLASPSQTASNQSNNTNTSVNRKSPGAGMGIPPTTVLMPLNQRNLLSIQQQQQLQQFQQQFGYSPISPGGSRVSGGRSSGNNNNNFTANVTGGSHIHEKMLDITIDQLDISPMGSPPQAQQNVKQLSVPSEEVTTNIPPVAAQNQVKPDAPKSMSSPSMQNTRPKSLSNQSSSKSSLQSQVDSYNRLLKMKKLTPQSAAPLTPSTATAPAPVTGIDAPQASQPETSSVDLVDKMPTTTEEVLPIEHVVPATHTVQESDAVVDHSQDMEADIQIDLVKSNDEQDDIPEAKDCSSAVPIEQSNYVEGSLPVSSNISEVEVQEVGVVLAEPTPVEVSNTEKVDIIVHEPETRRELPQEDIVPEQVDEADIQAVLIAEPTELDQPSSPIPAVTSNEREVHLVTMDTEKTDNVPSDKLNNEETFPETAEADIPSTIIEEPPEASQLLSEKSDVIHADISTKLDTSAFSIDNVVESPSNGLETSLQPVSADTSNAEDTTVSQQAAKYKVLLRNNQKKKKKR